MTVPKIRYQTTKFKAETLAIIEQANEIIQTYADAGQLLTLRQLYYRFIALDAFPDSYKNAAGSKNNVRSYKKLGSIVNDARLAGLIDWEMIEDRTREVDTPNTWNSPAQIIRAISDQFRVDKWRGQEYRVEVWVEKEALAGVFGTVCRELQLSLLSCRGFLSQSEMWRAANRMRGYIDEGQQPVILHFGDHDPSGLDMSRDNEERLRMFLRGGGVDFRRLALSREQIAEHEPPPNPAKSTDSRYAGYEAEHGDESWELDALDPVLLAALVRDEVVALRDQGLWDERVAEEDEHLRLLGQVSERWDELTTDL